MSAALAANRYVKTRVIRDVVRGQEMAVLKAVGIDWTGTRGHIDCPYRDHGGKADWRWDDSRKIAFCTCIGKRPGEKGAHRIIDVVMVAEGLDFEGAKIRIAEIIGRADLIGTRRGLAHVAKSDLASLLSPTAENADEELVWTYLAHRLAVDPAAVPRTSTPVAGLRRLDYYDPPEKKGGRPVRVATTPCAVFGQLNRDGERHAHRIYLAPGGLGKADLGDTPNGDVRSPKKSARVVGNENTAGRAVLWGSPETATLTIISEGIETGAALALAFQAEVVAGSGLIAACVSAAGVEASQPWAATKRVIVAADRDEGTKPDGRDRDHRGERAARRFCLRAKGIAASVALPGGSGEKVDWLDILLRDGIDSVRSGVLAAVPFEATDSEIGAEAERRNRADELERIEKLYPLPCIEGMRLRYQHTLDGRIAIYKFSSGGERWERKCTPIGVSAQLRMADAANTYGLRVLVEDMDGEPRSLDLERSELARMGAAEIRAKFFAAGLRVEGDGEHVAIQILKAATPSEVITVVSRSGWHALPSLPDPIFVTPAGEVFGAPGQNKIELAVAIRLPPRVARAGTLTGWQEAVAAGIEVDECPHWTLGAISGFVGPLIALAGFDTCGINFSGDTSIGKTTAQQLAVSAWSSPAMTDGGLLRSMRATENAVELLAQASNGTILALDEVAHADGKTLGRMIYSLASNVGKSRMRSDATMRQGHGWSTFTVLSGESGLAAKVRGEGGQWTGGMTVRLADIDLTGVSRAVPQDQLARLKKVSMHYGHAGPEFVRQLVECELHQDGMALKDMILKAAGTLAGSGADGAKIRAAIPFALMLVAGQLAQQFGILPLTAKVGKHVTWAWRRYVNSSDAAVLEPEDQAIDALRTYIAEGWDVTIKSTTASTGVNNREACGWYDDKTVYLPTARLREAGGGLLKEQKLAQVLKSRGLLSEQGSDRIAIKYVPKVGP